MRKPHLCLAAAFLAANAFADPPQPAQTNALQMISSEHMPRLEILERPSPEPSFRDDYLRRIDRNSSSILDSRIGYPAGLGRYIDSLGHRGSEWYVTEAHSGARSVQSLVGGELGDAVAARLRFTEPDSPALGWIWRHSVAFIDNSLANSAESRQRLSIYSSEEDIIQDGYWQEAHPRELVPRMGVRAFESRPYVYLEWCLGRQAGGLPIAYFDLRGYTDLGSLDRFGAFKPEAIMRLPVDHLFQITIGFSGYPLEQGRNQRWGEVGRVDFPVHAWNGAFGLGVHREEKKGRAVLQYHMTF